MSYLVSPEFFRVALLGFITSLHMTWRRLVNQLVPLPYLDEYFHVPQAQAYWRGDWASWDPKITTPPGLYLYSYAVNAIRALATLDFSPSIDDWRFTNVLLLYVLLVVLYVLAAVGRRKVQHDGVLQREFAIVMFPLIFFFSALYYTDLLSVLTVLLCHICWSAAASSTSTPTAKLMYQCLHVLTGLLSLATRQTNIFWVAVFLGGLQVVTSIKRELGIKKVHDPPMAEAYFEDFPIASISFAQCAVTILPRLLLDLWPQLTLLGAFASFVAWNGGVVLGDKDNHVATLHLPQMLYIWPLILFFSWPVLLPQVSHLPALRRRFPRMSTSVTALTIMLAVVKCNTLVHPFTLADNRHYVFYVFRLLMKHWLVKFAVVPVYYVGAVLVMGALGGPPTPTPPPAVKSAAATDGEDVVHVSYALVWLVATSLSLITAPLVEPRYFILPWLMWRLAVPEPAPRAPLRPAAGSGTDAALVHAAPSPSRAAAPNWLLRVVDYATSLELVWYILVNAATCYTFLYRGFAWPQEPGVTQRFLW